MATGAGQLQFRGFTSAELAANPLTTREFGINLTTGRIVLGQGSGTAAIPMARLDDVTGAGFAAQMLTWFNSLPTSLPGTAGVLWNNGGTLAKS